jgi:hypothetical protein
VSYPRDLDEVHEDQLREELERRRAARIAGVCDYCGRHPDTPECKFPSRHRPPKRAHVEGAKALGEGHPLRRLCEWLVAHPKELSDAASMIRLPLPTCEGFSGPCTNQVLWVTPGMTAYPWDGTGVDPNRDRLMCPECSAGYVEHWEEMWAMYRSGQL